MNIFLSLIGQLRGLLHLLYDVYVRTALKLKNTLRGIGRFDSSTWGFHGEEE